MSQSSEGADPKRPRRESLALVISSISLAVSIIVGLLSYGALHEERAVRIDGFAAANPLGDTQPGYGIRVALINESLRPVIVRSMTLETDGTAIAPATSFLPSSKFLTDLSLQPDQPILATHTFPVALGARSTRTMAVFFNLYEAIGMYAHRSAAVKRAGLAFCRAAAFAGPSKFTHEHEFSVLISSEPGADTRLSVEMTGPGDGGGAWFTSVLGSRAAPKGIDVRRKLAASTSVRLITIRIWRNPGGLAREVTRPLFGDRFSRFPFRPLPRGAYRVAFFDGQRVVAGGVFRVPLRGIRDRNVASPAVREFGGACHELLGSWQPNSADYRRE